MHQRAFVAAALLIEPVLRGEPGSTVDRMGYLSDDELALLMPEITRQLNEEAPPYIVLSEELDVEIDDDEVELLNRQANGSLRLEDLGGTLRVIARIGDAAQESFDEPISTMVEGLK